MKFGIFYKDGNEKAQKLSGEISEHLKAKGHEVYKDKNLAGSDFILTIGGDGTLIHTACEFVELGIPFVGLNIGRLGFLTAAEADDWKEVVEKLEDGKVYVSERIMVEAKVGDKEFRGVNEVAVKGLYRVIDLDVVVGGEDLLRITGDGVIVATQTGSTAYSLSSGGPIVDSDLDCLLITPINPIGLPIPSIVVSPNDEVEVKLEAGDDVSLIVDGQEHTRLNIGDSVLLSRAKFKIKFAYLDKNHFIKSLNAKFGLSRSIG